MEDEIAKALFDACKTGNVKSLQELLHKPLYIAKALAVEEHIVSHGILMTQSRINLFFMCNKAALAGGAMTINHLLKFALEHNVSYAQLVCNDSINSAISSTNTIAIFKEFLSVDPAFVKIQSRFTTPLMQTIWIGRNEYCKFRRLKRNTAPIIRFLLENGADPNCTLRRLGYGSSGVQLTYAIRYSSLEIVETLLQYGAEISQSGAMHIAAQFGRVDVMALLLMRGADVNERLWENDPWYPSIARNRLKATIGITSETHFTRNIRWTHETPLHISVMYRQVMATAWLRKHGAVAGIRDSEGWTARNIAIKMGDADVIKALKNPAEAAY